MIRRSLIAQCACAFVLAAQLFGQAPDEVDREAKRVRFANFNARLEPVVEIGKGGSAEAALEVYREWAKGNASAKSMPVETMAKIYAAAGRDAKAFKKVAWLIKSEEISGTHSIAMAEVREAAIQKIILEIGREKNLRIARSDSGNVTSGMKSDLDQTFYVFEPKLGSRGQAGLQ